LVAEGLGQKFHGPGFHGLHAHRNVAVTGDENNGDVPVAVGPENSSPRETGR
jgi:hypothetical protein